MIEYIKNLERKHAQADMKRLKQEYNKLRGTTNMREFREKKKRVRNIAKDSRKQNRR